MAMEKGRRSSMVTHWVAVVKNSSSSPEFETRISQSQYIHTITPYKSVVLLLNYGYTTHHKINGSKVMGV